MSATRPLSTFVLRVEEGKVREFSRAVWAPESWPVHPMFSVTSGHVQNRRELIGDIGLDLRRVLHGGHVWRYNRPLQVGDLLEGSTRIAGDETRESRRGGALRRVTLRTTYLRPAVGMSSDGEREETALEEDMILVEMPLSADRAGKSAGSPAASEGARRSLGTDLGVTVRLTRTDIVRFAGASGDFNPVHHDEIYARELGFPSVFAMGMLPAGVLASQVMRGPDPVLLKEVRVRFQAKVWPEEELRLRERTTEEGDIEIVAVNESGAVAVTLTATPAPSTASAGSRVPDVPDYSK